MYDGLNAWLLLKGIWFEEAVLCEDNVSKRGHETKTFSLPFRDNVRPRALDTGNHSKSRKESDTSLAVTIANAKIKTKDNNETLYFKVSSVLCLLYCLFWVRVVQHEPSAAVRVSIDQWSGDTGRLECKQVESSGVRTRHCTSKPSLFKRAERGLSSTTAAWWIPNKSSAGQKLWFRHRKWGCRWLEWSLLQRILSERQKQQDSLTAPPSPSLHLICWLFFKT